MQVGLKRVVAFVVKRSSGRATSNVLTTLADSSQKLSSNHCRLALGFAVAAALGTCGAQQPTRLEQRALKGYDPPPTMGKSFKEIHSWRGSDVEKLVHAVQRLDDGVVKEVLDRWPHGAELIDNEGNTLFHLLAQQSECLAARPVEAGEIIRLLLKDGWAVVDLKNNEGVRAENIAAQTSPVARLLLANRSRDWYETPRAEEPLRLCGEMSPEPEKWTYLLQDEQRRSFAGVVPKAFPEEKCNEWMKQAIEETPWNEIPGVDRKVAWYVSEDCMDCPYRYSGLEYPAVLFPPFMLEIRDEVCKLCGIPRDNYPNSCNINIYQSHVDEVPWHSDDEVLFQGLAGDCAIVSFSLGVARDFCWRLQSTTTTLGSVPVGHGDVMTMEGLFQKHYKHAVPKSATAKGPRINMTFRWIKVKAHAVDAGVKAKEYKAP